MIRTYKLFLALVVSVVAMTAAIPSVRHFNIREGLPNRQVYELQVDSSGFLWVYTLSGIVRYDGHQPRNYHLKDIDLSRDFTQAATTMDLTPEGNLLISIKTGQIYAYDPELDDFTKTFDFDLHNLPDLRIYTISTIGHELIIGTSDGIYGIKSDSIRMHSLPGASVFDVIDTGLDKWYAATDRGIYPFSLTGNGIEIHPVIAGTESISFRKLAYSHDILFAGSFSNGMFAYNISSGTLTRMLEEAPIVPVNALVAVGDTSLYVGFDGGGVYEVTIPSLATNCYIGYDNSSNGLSANTITDICTDQNGGLWVSTSTQGVNYLSANGSIMSVDIHKGSNSLLSDYVQSLYEDSDGDIWYGTDFGLSMKGRDGKWQHYLTRPDKSDMNILTITQTDDGKIWAGGYGTGVWCVDKSTHSVRQLPSRRGNTGVGTEYVFMMYPDGDNLWIGGIEGDMTRYNWKTGQYSYFPVECVGDMIRARDGRLYVTGCDGVGVMEPDSDTIQWSGVLGTDTLYHPTRIVMEDAASGELWFATDGEGIVRYNPADKSSKRIASDTRLGMMPIDGLAQDRDGRIWFCTETELYYIDPENDMPVNFTSALGRDMVSILSSTLTVLHDGMIMVGTSDGAITIDPKVVFSGDSSPKLIFNDIFVNNNRVTPGDDSLPVAINLADKIVLRHNENNFQVTFSAIDFTGAHTIDYQWMLEGRDSEWWNVEGDLAAEVRDLHSGEYTLIIRAIDARTKEELTRRSIPIVVNPPLWLTWWAILLYIIIICAIAAYFVRRVRERQREYRASEKLQSYLNIIHDLRTPLSLIKAPLSEVEHQDDLSEDMRRNVGLAMSNVDRLLGMVSRLLDLRRENDYSDTLNLSEVTLSDFLEAKVAEYRVSAIQKKLSLTVEVPDDMPPVKMDCNKISHILDNLLSNAVKYTFTGGITVKAWRDGSNWMISVADTGIGIPKQYHKRLFVNEFRGVNAASTKELGSGMGLIIVHRLCRLHKGSVKVNSEENSGTTFVLSFPINISAPEGQIIKPSTDIDEPLTSDLSDSREKVILVDDDHEMLEYLNHALSTSYNVVAFDNAEEAMARVAEINPDIVISDVKLNGASGFELCKTLKGAVETSHIPLVLLSGLAERQDMILGLESGANDYIVKPFDISVLRLRIRNILNTRRILRTKFLEASESPAEFDEAQLINELDKNFMDNLNRVLDEHISDSEYSITDLCRELAMGRTTLYNKIKALSGISINEFIRVRRLEKSRELLQSRKYSVSDVAYMVGFSDPKYFSTCFKKQFGTSPSKI